MIQVLGFIDAATHNRLCRSVLVDQARLRRKLAPEANAFDQQVLAANDEGACPTGGILRAQLLAQNLQVRRSDFYQAAGRL